MDGNVHQESRVGLAALDMAALARAIRVLAGVAHELHSTLLEAATLLDAAGQAQDGPPASDVHPTGGADHG